MPSLYSLFEITANKFVNNCAVISCDEKNIMKYISYQTLMSETKYVSTYLQNADICKNTNEAPVVGLYMEQTAVFPNLVLGVLCQNWAFMCLNLTTTEEEFHSVCGQLNISCIITVKNQARFRLIPLEKLAKLNREITISDVTIEVWEVFVPKIHVGLCGLLPCSNLNKYQCSCNLAYIVMTSGTCGKPKIVKVPHKCIVPNIQSLRSLLNVGPNDIVFLAAPLSFDPSVVELFLALTTGAAIFIVPNVIKTSPAHLLDTLFLKQTPQFKGVTVLQMTPSVISRWSDETIRMTLLSPTSTLKTLILGGEPCPDVNILRRWMLPESRTDVFNIYGITEVSCWATLHKVDVHGTSTLAVPLGTPLSETILQLRDEAGEVIVNGEGELFIGSCTRVCQIDSDVATDLSLPLFRATGDIVKVDSKTHSMFFIGRKNSVVKRWGQKINLMTIEETTHSYDIVENCCCVWIQSRNVLGLFVKVRKDSLRTFSQPDLRSFLAKHVHPSSLPDHMINLDEFPLTLHGKIDRQRLECLLLTEHELQRDRCLDAGSVCALFRRLWLTLLHCDDVHPTDTFASVGGTSIVAVQMLGQLEEAGYVAPAAFIYKLLGGFSFVECCECLKNVLPASLTTESGGQRRNTHVSISQNKQLSDEGHQDIHQTHDKNHMLLMSSCHGKTVCYPDMREVSCSVPPTSLRNITLTIAWTFSLDKCVDASPLYLSYNSGCAEVVVGSHSHSLAILDASNGKLKSPLCQLPDRIESSACVSICGRSIFVGCYDGAVYCVCVDNCSVLWRVQTQGMVKSSPTLCLDGSAITVGSYDKALYCINVKDGCVMWSTLLGSGSVYSSPAVSRDHQLIYAGTLEGRCCAVCERTGNIVWSSMLGSPVFSSPALLPAHQQVLFAEVEGCVHGFTALKGEKVWTFQANGNIFSSFCTLMSNKGEQTVLFGCHDQHLYCLEIKGADVSLKWKSKMDSAIFATPFVAALEQNPLDKNYAPEPDFGLVVAASVKGSVSVVSLNDGVERCNISLPHEVFSSPVLNGSQIFVGCRDNYIYSLNIVPID